VSGFELARDEVAPWTGPNLRSRRSFSVIEAAIAGVIPFRDFRVVHFGVEGTHLHLIVEADHNRALAAGMQGLTIRLAKGLNRLMGTRGRVFADRYHAHVTRGSSPPDGGSVASSAWARRRRCGKPDCAGPRVRSFDEM
jgi:hypothetical protein